MQGVLFAPFAIFHQFDSFRIILLVLVCAIIAALAFRARKSDSVTHDLHLTERFGISRKQHTKGVYHIDTPSVNPKSLKKAGPPRRCEWIIPRETKSCKF